MPDGPLIVQSDKTLLLEIDHAQAVDCRKAIAPFAELERAPEHVHTYRLSPLGLWNADEVERPAEIRVKALNLDGEEFEIEADGLLAVCLQHELDHLEGKVFVEYLSMLKQVRISQKMKKRIKELAGKR